MQFTSQFLDNLRSRITTSSVVGRRVRLVRKGREFHGLCPFHNEKTPSFTVNDVKGFYHCFGCGAHGDAIKFLMDTSGIGYVEAVTQLAGEIGLPLPKPDRKAQEKERQVASLYDVMEMACAYYQSVLLGNEGRQAREYLRSRGIGEDVIRTFRIGFAPDNYSSLKGALEKKGIPESQLKAAGLLTEKAGKTTYDKFRNRIIFPITDAKGRVIAFGGRILGEGMPKYLNSPETELFKKGEVLYNLAQAREAAYQTQEIIVAEGYMDVIAFHMAGITHAVAPLGTAITESQLSLLWKFAKEPTLCLDGDNAGKRAIVRAAMLALPLLKPGHSLRFALLPKGMDPDDIVRKEGSQAIHKYIQNALPLSETLWRLESVKRRVTPEQKADLEQKLKNYAAQILDKTVQAYYYKFFNEKLWQWSRAGVEKRGYKKPITGNDLVSAHEMVNQVEICEQTMLALMVAHPEILEYPEVEEELSYINFASEGLDKLCTTILEIRNFACFRDGSRLSKTTLIQQLEDRGFSKEVSLLTRSKQGFWEEFLFPGVGLETVRLGWKHAVIQRNLALMENEKQRVSIELTEESQHKAAEITKHIEALKKLLQTS